MTREPSKKQSEVPAKKQSPLLEAIKERIEEAKQRWLLEQPTPPYKM